MKPIALCTFALTLLLSSIGCADDYMLERTQDHVMKLRSFRGQLVESGVLASGDMRSSIVFRRPNDFVSRVIAPDSYAGVTLAYTGSTMTIYYPKSHYAIVFEHLTPATPDEERELVALDYRYGHAHYRYALGGASKVARHPVVELDATPLTSDAAHPRVTTQVYDKFSFPLAGTLRWKDATYSYRYDDITFDAPIYDAELAVPLPPDTLIARWDMAAPSLTLDQVRAQAGFEFALPAMKHAPDRIVRQAGPVPAFTLFYKQGPQQALISIFRDPGVRPASEDHGVPVRVGDKRGHLVVGPTVSTYTFTLRGTMYVVTANMPFDALLEMVSTIS